MPAAAMLAARSFKVVRNFMGILRVSDLRPCYT